MPWLKTEDGRLLNLNHVELIAPLPAAEHWELPKPGGVGAWLASGGDYPVKVAICYSEGAAWEIIDQIAAWLADGAPGAVFDIALLEPVG